MKKKALILQARVDDIAHEEFRAILKYSRLLEDDVDRIRMEERGLPEINLDNYWGVIIGGSLYNVADPEDKKSEAQRRLEPQCEKLLEEIIARDMPAMLACYGHAIAAQMRGGRLEQDPTYAETPGGVTIDLTDPPKKDPLLKGLPDSFRAFAGHADSCTTLPEGAVLLASSNKCPIHMFRLGKNVYSTQFHPELDVPGIQARIDMYKNEKKYFDSVEHAMEVRAKMGEETVTVPLEILKRFTATYSQQ